MKNFRVNPNKRLEDQGITGASAVYYNLLEPALIEAAVKRDEGQIGLGGAFLASTGAHTGRSPKDKFVVRTPSVENTVWWENDAPMPPRRSTGCMMTCWPISRDANYSCRTCMAVPIQRTGWTFGL